MKAFLLLLLVAISAANPMPDDSNIGDPVEVIVNGVSDGEPLEIGDLVAIKVQQHINGEIASAMDVLHPYSAAGIAEAALAASDVSGSDVNVVQESVVLPSPVAVEEAPSPVVVVPEVVIPEPIILPQPVAPEVVVPEPIVLPQPVVPEVVAPEPVVLPEPVQPEVVPELDDVISAPAPQLPQGDVYNDGTVQISINTPQNVGVVATLQSWLNVVLNYFGNGVQTTQQII